jgi:hypothetical protein
MEKITANRRELDAKEARAFFGNLRIKLTLTTTRRKTGINDYATTTKTVHND